MADSGAQDKTVNLSFKIMKSDLEESRRAMSDLVKDAKSLDMQGNKLAETYVNIGNSLKSVSARSIEARNNFLKGTQAIKDQVSVLDRLKAAQDKAGGDSSDSLGGGLRTAGRVGKFTNTVGGLAGIDTGPLGKIATAAKQAAPLLDALGASEAQIAAVSPIAAIALIGIAIAAQKLADDLAADKKRLDDAVDSQKTYYELVATGTTESINLGLKDLQVKIAVAQQVRRDVQAGQDQLKQFGILQGLAEQLTGLKDKAKAADDEIGTTQAQINAYTAALKSNGVAANDAAAAEKKLADARIAYAGTFSSGPTLASQIESIRGAEKSALDQMAQQRADETQAEADILQKGADQRVAIAQNEAEGESAALLNLQRANTDAQTKLGQQQADDRLAYQRNEVKSAQEHVNKLLQIRRDEQRSEADLIANRDFAGLAQARRDLNNKLDDEASSAKEAKSQRLTELKQRLQDDKTGFIREQQQRQLNYQRQLSDLRAAERRDLAANQAATAKALQLTRDKLNAQLKMEQAGYQRLLLQEAAFIKIRMDLLSGAISLAEAHSRSSYANSSPSETNQSIIKGVTSGEGLKHLSGGGRLGAGERALVNESFTSGRRTVQLPYGMGVFTPSRPGKVNSAGGMPPISISVHADTRAGILKEVNRQLDDALRDIA